jgi:two-component system phosphate regulon response regulator PhoB
MRRKIPPTGPVVVVADDDPSMRDFLKHVLTEAGYVPRVAADVIEAIDKLKEPGLSAAILDMMFVNSAGYSGMDLLQYIRHDEQIGNVPVIVITGFPINAQALAKIKDLHSEIWHKPFDPGELVERLHVLMLRAEGAGV